MNVKPVRLILVRWGYLLAYKPQSGHSQLAMCYSGVAVSTRL